jgi:hemerythrin
MTYFEWDSALETGHETIDTQHKALIELVNELQRAVDQHSGDENAVADAIYGLCGYVVEHFRDEEALMAQYHYPQLGLHRALHERLTAETLDMMMRYTKGEDIADQLAPIMCDWLKNHMMQNDMEMAKFVMHASMAHHAA